MASKCLLRNIQRINITSCTTRRPASTNPITLSTIANRRGYVTRAHPEPTPSVPIQPALETLLNEMEQRHLHRLERWENNKDRRVEQLISYIEKKGGTKSSSSSSGSPPTPEQIRDDAANNPYRKMDETVELALQLNLDPRKPGQSLRGSIALPHGNGKKFGVAVFTDDVKLAEELLQRGAVAAGGEELIDSIKDGTTSISLFERTLASPSMMSKLSAVARILGPRGLMPNPKLNTIIPNKEDMLDALDVQMSGVTNYRTDPQGIVRLGIGKCSFGKDKLLDNIREMMNEIQSVKPESFGKGKKKGQKKKKAASKGTKYYLKAHLSTTQSKGSVLVDLRTLDPTSSFFLSDPVD